MNAQEHKDVILAQAGATDDKFDTTDIFVFLYMWKTGRSAAVETYRTFVISLVMLNIVLVILESIEEIEQKVPHAIWQGIEALSVVVFTFDYVLNILTASFNPQFRFKRSFYLLSIEGLLDLLSVFPFWLEYSGVAIDATVFRIVRMNALFSLDAFTHQFVLM
jgi:hypothetical protein